MPFDTLTTKKCLFKIGNANIQKWNARQSAIIQKNLEPKCCSNCIQYIPLHFNQMDITLGYEHRTMYTLYLSAPNHNWEKESQLFVTIVREGTSID